MRLLLRPKCSVWQWLIKERPSAFISSRDHYLASPRKSKKGNLVSHICFRLRAATSSVKIDRLSRHVELWNINVILVIFFNSHGGLCLKVETVCNLYLLLLRLSLKYYIHSQGRRFFLRTSLRTSLAESLGDYNDSDSTSNCHKTYDQFSW